MLNKSLQRLSSGLRINSAKDDSAGLAISNRMQSQIRGLDQAVRNANDGISLAQTAEGALQESGSILQRIRELAVQSSSDGSTDSDRASMQIEVDELISELDRIANSTAFNGKTLLDGTFGTAKFQVGANAGQTISMTLSSAKTNTLGATGGVATGNYTMASAVTSDGSLVTAGDMATLGAGELSLNGTEIRAAISGDDTVSTTDNAGSALATAAAINASSGTTGVSAYAEKTSIALGITGGATAAAATGIISGLSINGVSIDDVTLTGTAAAEQDADGLSLATQINEKSDQTGVTASYSDANDEITLTAVDGRNIQLATSADAEMAAFLDDFAVSEDKVVRGNVTLYSNEAFTIAGTAPEDVGFSAGSISLDDEHWKITNGANTFSDLAQGDLVINGYNVIAPTTNGDADGGKTVSNIDGAASAKAIAYAINNTTGLKEEVSASAKTVANLGQISAYSGAAFSFSINGVEISFTMAGDAEITAGDGTGYLVGTMNTVFGSASEGDANYGLVASINTSGDLLITSAAGVNIDIDVDADNTNADGADVAAESSFLSAVDISVDDAKYTHKGTIALAATTGNSISSIEGGKQALAGIETAVGTIENVSVATYAGAQNAITAVDGALTQIDDQRAALGAIQNRFDSTVANLQSVSENLSAARSRILDADFAVETAQLTKAQILQQAGTAMLAQANMLPQAALSLLQ